MQTILGSNGVIGTGLAKELTKYTPHIRLVGRNPKKINDTDETFVADLLIAQQVNAAVANSEVVYLTAGLNYDIKVWQRDWPILIANVINACKQAKSKLVFFDNVYALGKVEGWMTEESPLKPSSKKGEVRKQVNEMLLNEMKKGEIEVIIARAADFYGGNSPLSFVNVMVFDNLKKGKKAQWLINPNKKHSFTYTADAAKGTAILGNTPSAYNQIWNLPTDKNVLTGKEFIAMSTAAFNVPDKFMTLPKWMIQMIGLFVPALKESVEMLYQSDSDYLFDSSKFEKAFNFKPTTYKIGIEESVASMK